MTAKYFAFLLSALLVGTLRCSKSATPPAVDTSAPTVTFSELVDGQYLHATAQIKVGAADNVGVSKLELSVDGTFSSEHLFTGASPTPDPVTFTWDTTQVSNSDHTLTVKAWDAAGNSASESFAFTVLNPMGDTNCSTGGMTNSSSGCDVQVNSCADTHTYKVQCTDISPTLAKCTCYFGSHRDSAPFSHSGGCADLGGMNIVSALSNVVNPGCQWSIN